MPTIEVHLGTLRIERIRDPPPQLKPDSHRSCTKLMFSKRNRAIKQLGHRLREAALLTRERVRPRRYGRRFPIWRLKEKAVLAQRDPRTRGLIICMA